MFNFKENVHCIDVFNNEVFSGEFYGWSVNDSGYIIACIKKGDKFIHIEHNLVCESETDAQNILEEKYNIHLEAEELRKSSEEKLNQLRIKILGVPNDREEIQ